jgi:hypothetical protein
MLPHTPSDAPLDPRRGIRRIASAALVTVLLALVTVMTTAAPAGAHGPGGLQPTNYQTRILRITPPVPDLRVRSVDLGNNIELTNHGDHDVVVLGYDDEPYLRVGPSGAYRNDRSPAVYINRSATVIGKVPASADPTAAPLWHRIGDGPTLKWHDHRTHWMGPDDPPSVTRSPGSIHLVQEFRLTLVRDPAASSSTKVVVIGDVRWRPGPSPWPWLVGALALGVAIVIAGHRRRWARTMGVALAILSVTQMLHVVGLWGSSTASSWSRLAAAAYALGGIVLAVMAIVVLLRRGPYAAVPVALLGALALTLAGGVADVTTLSRSQVPTTIAQWLDRLTVAVTLGSGSGLVVLSAWRLRRSEPRGPQHRRTESGAVPQALRARYRAPASD